MNEREIFVEALDIEDTSARTAYLDRACGEDAVLRERIDSLLKFQAQENSFLQRPIGDPDATALYASVSEAAGTVIGRYKLLEKIGEGGFGVVYMADQHEPVKRRVALKIIKLGMDTRQVIGRFEAERQALAMMDHPNIARVLDGGTTDSGRPYFVMELVRGIPITEFCDENQLSTRQRLQLFAQVCGAVQHAHQKGIIHRDLKPTNIMVTVHDDMPVPKIIDFGIAKAIQHQLTEKTVFTRLHHFIGTPAYMSPEQATFTGLDVDTRSDVYSLGILLYELLTGTAPFDIRRFKDATYDDICRTIREEIPPLPSKRISTLGEKLDKVSGRQKTEPSALGRTMRGDLDWIVMRSLEKDRKRRYETASALALDIQHYLNDEPVAAGPPSVAYRLRKFVRRNRLAVLSAGAIAAAMIVGMVAMTIGLVAARAAHRREAQQRQLAEERELFARRVSYASDMNLAMRALQANNIRRVDDAVKRQRPASGQQDLRGWEWRYLWQHCQMSPGGSTLTRKDSFISSVSFSHDGQHLAIGALDGSGEIWDLRSSLKAEILPQYDRWVMADFSPQAGVLATAVDDTVILRSVLQPNLEISVGTAVGNPIFSPDGRWLAASAGDGTVRVWAATAGEQLLSLELLGPFSTHLGTFCFGPESKRLAIGETDGRIRVFELPSVDASLPEGNDLSIYEFYAHKSAITAMAFSLDGERLLAACAGDSAVKIWDIRGEELGSLAGHRDQITCMAFVRRADTETLVTGSADATIRLWDVHGRESLTRFQGHLSPILALDVSPDGQHLASGDKDGVVNVWDVDSPGTDAPYRRFELHSGRSTDVGDVELTSHASLNRHRLSFRPDGGQLVVLDRRGEVVVVDLDSFHHQRVVGLTDPGTRNEGALFLTDDLLVISDNGGQLKIWNCRSKKLVKQFPAQRNAAVPIAVLEPDDEPDKILVTCEQQPDSSDFTLTEWNVSTGNEISSVSMGIEALAAMDISRDARSVVTANENGRVMLRSRRGGRQPIELGRHVRVLGIAFSPDGQLAATCGGDERTRIWDVSRQQLAATLHGHSVPVASVAFSPDGLRLATGCANSEAVKLWDLSAIGELTSDAYVREIATLQGDGTAMSVGFSPDGRTLVACSAQGNLHVWRAPSQEVIKEQLGRPAREPRVSGLSHGSRKAADR